MSKLHPIGTNYHRASFTAAWLVSLAIGLILIGLLGMESSHAQEANASAKSNGDETELAYPLAVAVDGQTAYVVDLDLPGVWKTGLGEDGERELFFRGSNLLRKPMNRPRCVVVHPAGGIIVGDTPTREIYHITGPDAEPKPLNGGFLGVPMALAISPDGQTLYVGDAERRATFKLPIQGGQPELVARVNARGLDFDGDGSLWAVTPDSDAVIKINVADGSTEAIIQDRPYQYPNGLTWAGDHGFITDGYGKSIWKFTADGQTELWHQGDPLVGPVGITSDDDSVYVADPKQKQLYRFDRKTKQATGKF